MPLGNSASFVLFLSIATPVATSDTPPGTSASPSKAISSQLIFLPDAIWAANSPPLPPAICIPVSPSPANNFFDKLLPIAPAANLPAKPAVAASNNKIGTPYLAAVLLILAILFSSEKAFFKLSLSDMSTPLSESELKISWDVDRL